MLRDWLDRNLPSLIEKVVEKELDKLARKAIDD
jgi:cell pole-organizing protein PopZ